MSLWTWVAIGVVGWVVLASLFLVWLANAKAAGERYDQMMADHYRDEDEQ